MNNAVYCQRNIVIYRLYFDKYKIELKNESKPTVKALIDFLNIDTDNKISLVDHTNNMEDQQKNAELSRLRARAVRRLLNQGYGVDKKQLLISDSDYPVPEIVNKKGQSRGLNRRVEILFK